MERMNYVALKILLITVASISRNKGICCVTMTQQDLPFQVKIICHSSGSRAVPVIITNGQEMLTKARMAFASQSKYHHLSLLLADNLQTSCGSISIIYFIVAANHVMSHGGVICYVMYAKLKLISLCPAHFYLAYYLAEVLQTSATFKILF